MFNAHQMPGNQIMSPSLCERCRGSSRNGVFLGVSFLLVALFGFFQFRQIDVETLIPVVIESSIPLVMRLDAAEQGDGYPEGEYHLKPYGRPEVNVDHAGVPFPVPPRGEAIFHDLPVHRGARLRFSYGFESVENGAGVPVTFEVKARPAGGSEARVLFAEVAKVPPVGSLPTRIDAEVALPSDLVGTRVDLLFACRSAIRIDGDPFIATFLSPVLLSEGREVKTETWRRVTRVVVDDLLSRYDAALDADEGAIEVTKSLTESTCFAIVRRAGGDELITAETTALDPTFVTDSSAYPRDGGPSPSLVFAWDGILVRYRLQVPSERPWLEFSIGVDHRSMHVGRATFIVRVDDSVVFEETLDPANNVAQRGFLPRQVDLSSYAGQAVTLAFEGATDVVTPTRIEMEEKPPLGAAVEVELDVRRVRAGFARPRVIVEREIKPRLAAKDRRSVIFVNVETLRFDALGSYGGDPEVTPELDRLARDGTRIEECITAAPWTAPSVASTFTGLYPWTHGVTSYARAFLADDVVTLAERVRDAGGATMAIVSNDLISSRHNFDQGFDQFTVTPYANAKQIVATFRDWLGDHRALQFFAYLHLFEPHDPCEAPGADRERFVDPELRGLNHRDALNRIVGKLMSGDAPSPNDPDVRLLRGLYLGEVRYLDRQIGELRRAIEEAGLTDRVVLIVTSDHGEEFLEHEMIGHGSQLYRESVQVPLILYGPGEISAGKVIAGPVENRALHGTVLDLMGVSRGDDVPSIDLHAANSGGRAYTCTEQGIREVDVPNIFVKTIHSVRSKSESLIYAPSGARHGPDGEIVRRYDAEYGLFDLVTDPGETTDLHLTEKPRLERLKQRMKEAYDRARSLGRRADDPRGVDSVTNQTLQQLGYVDGARTSSTELFEEDDSSNSGG